MRTEDNYRVKIEEWTEQVEPFGPKIKHTNYIVQRCYSERNWFERIICTHEPIWYGQGVYATMNEALLAMRNLHNRENPTIIIINLQ